MNLSFIPGHVRFHVPSLSCEGDVDRLSNAISSVEPEVEFAVDRGMREVEIDAVQSEAMRYRTAITDAGFCITR